MKLNRLPVLIRTEVTAAAKSASLPAVYSRALVVLEEAVNELSFAKLKQVDISVEGLAAWAKAHQDEQLTKTARELKFRARRTANYIAEQLVKQRKDAFVARGGRLINGNHGAAQHVPVGEPESGGIHETLIHAGYKPSEVNTIRYVARAPDDLHHAQLPGTRLRDAVRGKSGYKTYSKVYYEMFSSPAGSPLKLTSWFRNNNARGLARQLTDPLENAKARQSVALMRAWCEEFLSNLPKTVSKAKVSK